MIAWQEIFDSFGEPRHHAFIIAGEPMAVIPHLQDFLLREQGVSPPDLSVFLKRRLGVDDSRELKALSGGPVAGKHRFHLIGAEEFSPEALQALLKLLEEPPAGAVFILVYPRPFELLPTIRSRAWVLSAGSGLTEEEFASRSVAERLSLIERELKKREAEEAGSRSYLASILGTVEREIAAALPAQATLAVQAKQTLEVVRRLSWSGVRSSPKLLLEYLALLLPKL